MEEDVTRVSFEFSDLEPSVRENIEADSFWCMTKVRPTLCTIAQLQDIVRHLSLGSL